VECQSVVSRDEAFLPSPLAIDHMSRQQNSLTRISADVRSSLTDVDESMNRIVTAWPRVHKRKPDAERAFTVTNQQREQALARIDGLPEAMAIFDDSR